jgi:hypothetical protein
MKFTECSVSSVTGYRPPMESQVVCLECTFWICPLLTIRQAHYHLLEVQSYVQLEIFPRLLQINGQRALIAFRDAAFLLQAIRCKYLYTIVVIAL